MVGIFISVLPANFLFQMKLAIQKNKVKMFSVSMLIKLVVPKKNKGRASLF